MQTLREGDGQSYFYVLWPEDRAAESSVRSQGAMPQLFQKVDGMLPASPGSPAQEDDGLPDNSTSNGHSSSNGNARCRSREDETARAATDPTLNCSSQLQDSEESSSKLPTSAPSSIAQVTAPQHSSDLNLTHPQSYSGQEGKQRFLSSSSLSSSDSSPGRINNSPSPKRHCGSRNSAVHSSRGLEMQKLPTKRSGLLVADPAASSPYFPPLTQCLECEVKDAEIQTLRKRIQVMQEHLAVLLSANRSSGKNKHVRMSGTERESVSSSPERIVQGAQNSNDQEPMSLEGRELSVRGRQQHTLQNNVQGNHQSGHRVQQFEVGESVELVRGSGVYISSQKLDESLREAKNGTQLARKLMDAFWDKGTLARSSVSPRSKYQYQQLDPKITAAIETYCLGYDRNTHPKDLHATMTDKCCQCRRGVSRI